MSRDHPKNKKMIKHRAIKKKEDQNWTKHWKSFSGIKLKKKHKREIKQWGKNGVNKGMK